jgi:LPXTG-site transpeptidase (sortase) family protein
LLFRHFFAVSPAASGNQIADDASYNIITPPQIILEEQKHSALPVRLKIPKMKVDALIEYVSITPDGAMDVPKNQKNVAWFSIGTRPGEIGSAVISGHYGWKGGKASVFDALYTLRKGDTVYVQDAAGITTAFVVRESRRYDENADAADVFRSTDGKAHVNFITCEGIWNSISKSYSNRLVVFTDKK